MGTVVRMIEFYHSRRIVIVPMIFSLQVKNKMSGDPGIQAIVTAQRPRAAGC